MESVPEPNPKLIKERKEYFHHCVEVYSYLVTTQYNDLGLVEEIEPVCFSLEYLIIIIIFHCIA